MSAVSSSARADAAIEGLEPEPFTNADNKQVQKDMLSCHRGRGEFVAEYTCL